MKKQTVKVTQETAGLKIDLAWVKIGTGLSRRKIRQIIDSGGAFCNKKRIRFASLIVKLGDELTIQYDLESLKKTHAADISIAASDLVYEDAHLIAMNKPPLLTSQATKNPKTQHVEVVLESFLKKRNFASGDSLKSDQKFEKLGICHRLDKETSGVFLIGKSSMSTAHIMEQFKLKEISKTYHAICIGIHSKSEWEVVDHLSPIDKKTGLVRSVKSGGKWASTSFKTLVRDKKNMISLVECKPLTGRSHQIRVHLESAGLPILGDKKYGPGSLKRSKEISSLASLHHMLHALKIEVSVRPGSKKQEISAKYPPNFEKIICHMKK